jgi:nitroreductase
MDTLKAINTRRSIRKYKAEEVPQELLEKLLKSALQAPSAGDARPWHFVVIADRGLLRALADEMPGCEMLETATLGILVCADPRLEEIPGFWPQDCAVATEHILLAAHALGLGGCWIGLHPVESRTAATAKLLGLPEGVIPFALCSLGWPDESLSEEDRWDAGKIHYGREW